MCIRDSLVLALSLTGVTVSQIASARGSPVTPENILIHGQTHMLGTVNVKDLLSHSHPAQSVARGHSKDEAKLAEGKSIVEAPGYVPPGEASKTVVTSPTSTQPLTTNLGLTLEGAPGAAPNPCVCTPPDGAVGAGPNHVFEMVNLAGIIYAKTGVLVKPTFGLDTFFNLPASAMSDPEIMYDLSSGRWFASIANLPGSSVRFAVSTSNDPTGTFLLYSVSAPGSLTDQPFIATNDDKFVISVNDFNSRNLRYQGVQYWVLNKAQLVAGAATVDFVTITPDGTMFSLHPARHLTSTSAFYMITDCSGSCISSATSTTTTATVVALSGTPPGVVTKTASSFSIVASVIPPSADQPGGTTLATNDNRILRAVWESNTLWYSANDACIPAGDSVTRSCVRLVQANTSGTLTKGMDFDYAVAGGYLFYPALTLSQGELAVVYGTSSTTVFPSLLVTGRLPGDPANTLQAPVTIRTGTAADTSTRYGDYFGAATDPATTQASTFWVSGEYRASSAASAWNTAIGQVGSLAPSPSTITASFNQTSTFQGYQTTSSGTLLIDPVMSSVSGTASVMVRNQTTGAVVLSRTYQLSGIHLFGTTTLQASFVLDIAVTPYHLSSDINVKVTGNNAAVRVLVTRQVDIDLSGVITIIDIGILAAAFGTSTGDPRYNPLADIDANGDVSIIDFGIVAAYFGSIDFL